MYDPNSDDSLRQGNLMSRRVLRGAGAPGGVVGRRDRHSGVVEPSIILADQVIALKTNRPNVLRGCIEFTKDSSDGRL